MLGRLRQVLEEALGVCQPTPGHGERATRLVVPRERQRHARGAELVARGRVPRVRALAERDRLVELAAPPGGLAVSLEVGRRQLSVRDAGVGAVRRPPGLAVGSGTSLSQCVDDLRHGHSLSLCACRLGNAASRTTPGERVTHAGSDLASQQLDRAEHPVVRQPPT